MKHISLHQLITFQNKWVALSKDRKKILLAGNTIEETQEKLKKENIKDAILTYIPSTGKYISPVCR